MTTIGIVMTCFNRRDKTLDALEKIFTTQLPAFTSLRVHLTDAASSDGTAESVGSKFPQVHLIQGDQTMFWNAGMRKSLDAAYAEGADFVLWLNDDTVLTGTAISDLIEAYTRCEARTGMPAVIVGTTLDPLTNRPTYGGVSFPVLWRKTTPTLIDTREGDVECNSLNGNIALVPRPIYEKVGNLDSAYIHGLGDFDYGFRVRSANFKVFAAAGHHGYCARNDIRGTFRDENLPLFKRWSLVCGPKGRPWKPWLVFTRRHCGPFWIVFWLWPYLYTVTTSLLRSFGGRK
jgi:GT2 family glycosyltransferase